MGDPAERRVPVYLPPDYDDASARYPVVYFLAGFSGGGTYLLSASRCGARRCRSASTAWCAPARCGR